MRQGRSERDVMNYKPPQGPKNIMDAQKPGANNYNCGKQGSQGATESRGDGTSGKPGLGGENCGPCGTQGKY